MKHAALFLLATAAVCGAAHAGIVAGAKDGGYRSSDGDYMLVDSKESLVGVQGLDCHKPVVEGGRLRAKRCWANGHLGGDIDVSWRVEGDAIVSEGKRYLLLPPRQAATPSKPMQVATASNQSATSPEGWSHNGSDVRVDPRSGVIAYTSPKLALRAVAREGTVLFRGSLRPGGPVEGTAYAYKPGCAPAPYQVRGSYSQHNEKLTLSGAGPVRKGCDVVGFSDASPHSKLVFEYAIGD